MRVKAALLSLQYAGIKVMIIRKTYPELTENHINPMCEMLRCYHPDKKERIASYNDSKKNIVFPNGSRILFRYCDNEKDAERFQGTEVDVLFIDEATHQSEEKMKKLTACVRGVNDFPKRIYMTCNPGGEGHGWVKRLFIDRVYQDNENPEDYMFIQSLVTDNKALMESNPDYLRQLEALPPRLRKMWLDGDWQFYDGQFFEDFIDRPEHYQERQWTHVIDPFEIPDSWKIYRSFDWGYNKPFSCGWWAIDPNGRAYRYREWYGCEPNRPNVGLKLTPPQIAQGIIDREKDCEGPEGLKVIRIADPAIFDRSRGESVAQMMEPSGQRPGVYFSPGDHNRLPGKAQFHERLRFGEDGLPKMQVFKTCTDFIRTIPALPYSLTKVEDIDSDAEDHIYDEARYFFMENPLAVKAAPKYEPSPYDPFKEH